MKKIVENVVVFIMMIIIIIMSILLLSFNKYKVSEIGNKTLLLMDEKMNDYSKGSLLVVEKKKNASYKSGDYIFFYDLSGKNAQTVLAPIIDLDRTVAGESSYIVGDKVVEEEYIIGKKDDTKEYKKVGKVLSVLESKWGNLFLVVVPSFLIFLYEAINLTIEIKTLKKKKQTKQEVSDNSNE